GYIKLTGFTRTASSEVRAAFKELRDKEGMEQLIFDLRGNGGGLLREAVNIVNFFVPKGEEIVSTRGKLEDWNKTHVGLNEPLDTNIPVVILIDGTSASASEIVSGALQDYDRAVVVGNTSFGKGLVQQTKDVAYNTKLKLTVAKYYIPSGRCIQKLDYSHRSREGDVDEVPDSLITPFLTKGGRTVFDGRGISPDVEVELDELSHVLRGLMISHVDFHWATLFAAGRDSITDPANFRLTDDDYASFVEFAMASDFDYSTGTEEYFDRLKDVAEAERYFKGAEGEFEQLLDKIKPNRSEDLIRFKDQIKQHLEHEVVARSTYQTGRIKNQLNVDPVVKKAFDVFASSYDQILSN
ncbi:MAG: peptidase S41, partial [Flavobacteriales bacterium]|nr:peptidase S41 [Flavobacteriales bacterium]